MSCLGEGNKAVSNKKGAGCVLTFTAVSGRVKVYNRMTQDNGIFLCRNIEINQTCLLLFSQKELKVVFLIYNGVIYMFTLIFENLPEITEMFTGQRNYDHSYTTAIKSVLRT